VSTTAKEFAMVNEDQQVIIRNTFATIATQADMAAHIFYQRLFYLEPDFRTMFRVRMDEQGHHFMLAVSAVVTAIAAPDLIKPILRQLGKRHLGYGVEHEHYEIMKRALLGTLRDILKDDYTPSVEEAWSALYTWLVDIATDAAPV
jgi:hemoglobin-like flavoprotein